jgi:hypothetical protein
MTPGVLLRSIPPFARRLVPELFILTLLAPSARADTIVYTGEGPICCEGWSLRSTQWLAGDFTVARAYSVTSIEGWVFTNTPGDLTVSLHRGGGNIPGTPVFSQTIRASRTVLNSRSAPVWTGATNLQWLITPGAYWAAFEVRDTSTFAGGMPHPTPDPTLNEAYTFAETPAGGDPRWAASTGLDFGLRVLGDPVPAPTPEPATLVLLGTAAIAIGGRAWRRRRAI